MPDALPTPRLFLGKSRPVLDPKHRITIPSAWREGETERFFLTPASGGTHINVLPPAEFQKAHDALDNQLAVTNGERRSFARVFFSEVQPCTTDRQGRIVVPDEFCRLAGLEGELLLLGAYSCFEIWNPARWAQARPAELETANRVGLTQGL